MKSNLRFLENVKLYKKQNFELKKFIEKQLFNILCKSNKNKEEKTSKSFMIFELNTNYFIKKNYSSLKKYLVFYIELSKTCKASDKSKK